jgi:hypothetical protein
MQTSRPSHATFWLDNLILDKRIMPNKHDFENDELLRRYLGPLVWDHKNKSFFDPTSVQEAFDALKQPGYDKNPKAGSAAEKIQREVMKLSTSLGFNIEEFNECFSYDVIYKLENFRLAFDIPNVNCDIVQSQLESILGLTSNGHQHDISFQQYIVWNVRKQKFEYIQRGISNYDIQLLMENSTSAYGQALRSYLINAFSMCSREGEEVTLADLHSYRGNWGQFYPRRFTLKDSLYEQRLDLLAYLLRYCLKNYATCNPPVGYVEFSVGVGDLSRPWVLEVLATYAPATIALEDENSFNQIRKKSMNERMDVLSYLMYENKVEYHFLAGFNRSSVNLAHIVDTKSAIDLLISNGDAAIAYYMDEFNKATSDLFQKAVDELQELAKAHTKESYITSTVPAQDNNPRFTYWIVGFDLFGEELGYPYCPFITQPFLNFIRSATIHNPRFGVRIHCAETIPLIDSYLPGFALFCNHLFISFIIIKYLIENNIRVRIGHGVVFATVMASQYGDDIHRKSAVKLKYIQDQRHVFKKTVFELNLTSNFYLLHNPQIQLERNDNVLSYLLQKDIPVILATDDDGIWPLDTCTGRHFAHHSLAHEICRVTNNNILEPHQLDEMLAKMEEFSFYAPNVANNGDDEAQQPHNFPPIKPRSEIIPPFLISSEVACTLKQSEITQQNPELLNLVNNCVGSKLSSNDNQNLKMAAILAAFLGDETQPIDNSIKQIITAVKNDFLKGGAFQCQMLHVVVESDHHIILSQPEGIDKLMVALDRLANDATITNQHVKYYIFMKNFDEKVIEAIRCLWDQSPQKSPEAHVFTKSKERAKVLATDLKCKTGIILVDERSEDLKRTYPVIQEFTKVRNKLLAKR